MGPGILFGGNKESPRKKIIQRSEDSEEQGRNEDQKGPKKSRELGGMMGVIKGRKYGDGIWGTEGEKTQEDEGL